MSRGRRYEEPKLNMKKVFAVIIAFIVFIMCIFMINSLLLKNKENGKITTSEYYPIFKNDKWGVIDSKGKTIIEPSYGEMIVIPNNKNDIFLCTYDVNYENNTYKTKALNSKNEEILKEYQMIEAIANKDANDNLWYEEKVLKVQKDGKYGLIDYEGKEIAKCDYENIEAISGLEKAYKITKNGKKGVITEEGKIIVRPEYKDIEALGKEAKEGFIVENDESKKGIVDCFGKIQVEPKYESISKKHKNDNYIIKENGKDKIIKKDGTILLEDGYDEIVNIVKSQEEQAIIKKGNKMGVINFKKETILDPIYDNIKEGRSKTYIVKKDGKYGIIDENKQTKLDFKYTQITYYDKANLIIAQDEEFNDKILDENYQEKLSGILIDLDEEKEYMEVRINDEYKFYNFKCEEKDEKEIFDLNTIFLRKKNGKYGFEDKKGNVVVDYIYEDATRQNHFGYAGIKKDGKWGVVNGEGKIILEPQYNLDEYLKIDFIGTWHLGKDLNMNYYNQF